MPNSETPIDCSPPGSSVHEIFQARILEGGCHFLCQRIFPPQGSNPGLLHFRQILYWLSYKGSPCLPDTAAAAKPLQSCPTLCDPIDGSPPASPVPGDSPGKNTGVGCHFLLQCVKVKSESEAPQSCPTLCDPMDCSLPGSSILGIFQARVLEWGAIAFSRITVKFSSILRIN